jgi:hypothetical protein
VFVIDLGRLPSHGQAVGIAIRQRASLRRVPIVFAAGDPAKTARVQKLLPDAVFTPWSRMRSSLKAALRAEPPTAPAVPGTMSGYSGTPLPKKLGIGPEAVVALLGAPTGFERTLGALPDGVRFLPALRGRVDLILLFARSQADLKRRLGPAARAVTAGVGMWIAWPKKTSPLARDLTEREVRAMGLATGLVDYKICAIDADWSGLKFTQRRAGAAGR